MSLQALIFDVDGTIAETETVHCEAFNLAFRAHGLDWHWDRQMYAELLQVTGGKERIASYLERRDGARLDAPQRARLVAALHATKTELYHQLLERAEVRARPGILQLMDDALAANVRLAIASTTSVENIEPLLRCIFGREALHWFSAIATGDMVRHKKPAPDVYEVALELLKLDAAFAMAIEDSAIGVQAAKAAGLYTVATPNSWTESQDFSSADLVLVSLADAEPPAAQSRVGTKYLGFAHLVSLHAAALAGGARPCRS